MLARTSVRVLALAPVVVLACVLSACGSGGPESSVSADAIPNAVEAESSADLESYPLPDCEGKDPATCSYDGFDPMIDGFSFANWGGTGKLGATGMIALFGENEVCAQTTASGCVLYPAAKEWADQINEALAGGHCEGMAVMAARLFRGDAAATDLDPAAQTTFDLVLEDPDVENAIDTWWATQMLAPVQEAYMAFHTYQPSEIAAELAAGLQRGDGYTMGIYSEAGAHAITPFAVTEEGDMIAVSVYDNNFPGTVQRIMIDPAAERWSYAMGSTNPDAPTGGWEGGIGTIELTPMASRVLPAFAPFDDEPAKGVVRGNSASSHLLVTSPDPQARVGFTVTIDGQEYDTTDPNVALPAGVLARSTLGAVYSGKGMALVVDRSKVKSFMVSPKAKGDGEGATPITMSIDAVDSPRVTLRAKSEQAAASRTSFTVDRRGTLRIAAADGSDPEVNVANGLNSVDFTLPDGIDMNVDPDATEGSADIEYVDEDGNVVGEYTVDDETEDGSVMDGTAEFDPESGEFDVTEEEAQPEDVDEEILAWLGDDANGDSASDSMDSGSEAQDESASESGQDSSDSSTVDEGGADQGAADDGAADDGAADEGAADEGGADEGGADQGAADDGAADQGAADEADPEE